MYFFPSHDKLSDIFGFSRGSTKEYTFYKGGIYPFWYYICTSGIYESCFYTGKKAGETLEKMRLFFALIISS